MYKDNVMLQTYKKKAASPDEDESVSSVRSSELRAQTREILNRVQFYGETFIIERNSEPSALMIPYDERHIILSDRDRDTFLAALDSPPKPNQALKKAMRKHRKRHG